MRLITAVVVSSVLAACSGEDDGFCAGSMLGGTTDVVACPNCSVANPEASIDDAAASAATLVFGVGGGRTTVRATAPAGTVFPAGADVGALMRFPTGNFTGISVTFNLYRSGAPVSTGSGGAASGYGEIAKAGEVYYYNNASTPLEFDTVEAVVSLSGNTEDERVELFEFCGDR